jgi:hypothetical protein
MVGREQKLGEVEVGGHLVACFVLLVGVVPVPWSNPLHSARREPKEYLHLHVRL